MPASALRTFFGNIRTVLTQSGGGHVPPHHTRPEPQGISTFVSDIKSIAYVLHIAYVLQNPRFCRAGRDTGRSTRHHSFTPPKRLGGVYVCTIDRRADITTHDDDEIHPSV